MQPLPNIFILIFPHISNSVSTVVSYKDAWPTIIIRYRLDSNGSIQGPTGDFCDHDKEFLSSVKAVNAFNTSATTDFQERPLAMVTELSIHAK
jgi:hypothetical protein